MSGHTGSLGGYIAVFMALMVLTALTVFVAFVDLGHHYNDVVALAIATTKATLVLLFFMHMKDSARLTWLVVAGAVFWFAVLVAFVISDIETRALLGTIF